MPRALGLRTVTVLCAGLLTAGLIVGAGPVGAAPAAAPLCTPPAELGELSGLSSDGQRLYATNDGGDRIEVLVLDRSCKEIDRITADVDPYDVEDLAVDRDGTLWVADAGDNDLDRETVAVHKVTADGAATLYRLTYPDGPRDSEAIVIGPDEVPYLISKELLGPARVYRPSKALVSPGPTPLEEVGQVEVGPTDTPGGPVGRTGSTLVTGGAMSPDGTVVALRTYTDAYLFRAEKGAVAGALRGKPVRIPLPDEEQGEAIALESDGTLLSATEGGGPIVAVRGAAAALDAPAADEPVDRAGVVSPAGDTTDGATGDDDGLEPLQAGILAIILAVGLMGAISLLRRFRRRRSS